MGEKILTGLSSSSFLAINAKGGESINPKAKGLHHHIFKKISKKHEFFQLVCEVCEENSQLIYHLVFPN
jgi:hypothetical protein